ncbi:TetR/AcrR family transcriptional regulator [Heyndrickxia coagulans]|uniref:TetR/AcrR family transcriptional regulator n=1 Tax=Heyndrickxia coagulans TaxID=1398 RepID=A0AAW7C842_HEYCO|nr:TetR/AcrR family transcriptional regulator [Heyndrickxia coagulans]
MDRRVLKSQAAIKNALIELMAEKNFDDITIQDIADRADVNRGTIYLHYEDKFDLLDKLIEEHIDMLQKLCEDIADMSFTDGEWVWFDYFEKNYLFFSTMLESKGAPYFRTRFLQLVIEELKGEVDAAEEKNQGLSKDVVIHFFGAAIIGIVEWWVSNGMPYPPREVAEQVGKLLDRNF